MIDYTKPAQVLEAYGITELEDELIFCVAVVAYFDALYCFIETLTKKDILNLVKESCEYARELLQKVNNE